MDDPLTKEHRHPKIDAFISFFWKAAVLVFLVVIIGVIYTSLDESGWMVHYRDTPVWIKGDWMIGELRTCNLETVDPLGPSPRSSLPRLYCSNTDNGIYDFAVDVVSDDLHWETLRPNFHILSVKYWGQIDRLNVPSPRQRFKCRREQEQVECKALS